MDFYRFICTQGLNINPLESNQYIRINPHKSVKVKNRKCPDIAVVVFWRAIPWTLHLTVMGRKVTYLLGGTKKYCRLL